MADVENSKAHVISIERLQTGKGKRLSSDFGEVVLSLQISNPDEFLFKDSRFVVAGLVLAFAGNVTDGLEKVLGD